MYDFYLLRLEVKPWISEVKLEMLTVCWMRTSQYSKKNRKSWNQCVALNRFIGSYAIFLPLRPPWHFTAVRIKEILCYISRMKICTVHEFLWWIISWIRCAPTCCFGRTFKAAKCILSNKEHVLTWQMLCPLGLRGQSVCWNPFELNPKWRK